MSTRQTYYRLIGGGMRTGASESERTERVSYFFKGKLLSLSYAGRKSHKTDKIGLFYLTKRGTNDYKLD